MQTEFFKHLFEYCDGKIEIRLLPSRKQQYFALNELDQLSAYVKQNSKQDIYFGVATRDGAGGTKANIVHIPSMWCDADFKDIDRKKLYKRLKDFPFSPSIIVKSGGGAHMYWLLKEPSGPDEIQKIEDVNRRIAAHFGGDMNAIDAARILRVPGTKNRKYKPARAVEVSRLDRFYYVLDDFLDLLPEVETSKSAQKNGNRNPGGWLVEALMGVQKTNPGRNATGTKIAGYFINRLPYRDVLTILTAYGRHCSPPLKSKEVDTIARSVSRYKSKNEAQREASRKRVTLEFNRN